VDIGIACENRPQEKRVVIRPDELKKISAKHTVFVEKGLGKGIGIKDNDYKANGARIADKKKVYSSTLVVRIKEPVEEELKLMKPGSTIMAMLHLPGNPKLQGLLDKYKIQGISMEDIRDVFGERKIEALYTAGYLGMEKGFELWGKDPEGCVVKIMGYGNVAFGAIRCAARKFASIDILNKSDFGAGQGLTL
jgi:alanine dehydrogenase